MGGKRVHVRSSGNPLGEGMTRNRFAEWKTRMMYGPNEVFEPPNRDDERLRT